MTPNQTAFLTAIATSEGTVQVPGSDNGYNVLVGGTLFTSYADHPHKMVWIPRLKEYSSAAGRYQLLGHYYDLYKTLIPVSDFSPISQDTIALQQIKESLAAQDVINGNIETALAKCAHIWASLPGNLYSQGANTVAFLLSAYAAAGGKFTPDTVNC